jgi:hypothetical protein
MTSADTGEWWEPDEVPEPVGAEKERYDLIFAELDLRCDPETRDRLMARTLDVRNRAVASGIALRRSVDRFAENIRAAMLRVNEEPTEELRARRLEYLMALHYIAKKGYALADDDHEAAERWQAISDRFMNRAYGLES